MTSEYNSLYLTQLLNVIAMLNKTKLVYTVNSGVEYPKLSK